MNLNGREKTQIGWYNLPEKEVFTNHFETAAWYENVEVEAGRYPVYMYDLKVEEDGRLSGPCGDTVYVSLPGKVTDDYFGGLWCGVPFGSYDEHKHTGNEAHHTLNPYDYMVAERIANGNSRYELFPEYEVRVLKEWVDDWDGKPRKLYGIYKKEA